MAKLTAVFVHGWSVTNVATYGELPLRLKAEALAEGIDLEIEEIFLGKYISFHDEVKVADISRAFQVAINEQLTQIINAGERFVCITHSTGGPVMRDWWYTYFAIQKNDMSNESPRYVGSGQFWICISAVRKSARRSFEIMVQWC